MEILKDKSVKNYNYTSRYSSIPYYYNLNDNKYVYGLTKNLSLNSDYIIHTVTNSDTLDSIAFKYYGRPDLFWVIADFNRMQDSFIYLYDKYNFVKVPVLNNIMFEG